MKVSFDFDDTLDKSHVQSYAQILVNKGIEVHIVTSRMSDDKMFPIIGWNTDLYEISDAIGIKREHIHFTNGGWKREFFLKNPDFLWHLDNDFDEIVKLKQTAVKPISVLTSSFVTKCNRLIKNYENK